LSGPIRTCVGCRQRAPAAELLRVVARSQSTAASVTVVLRPDIRRRQDGRGAWVHLDAACVDTAVQRRAFARALRVSVTTDVAPLLAYVAERLSAPSPAPSTTVDRQTSRSTYREGEKKFQ
jgi:predicted RNA-binding protein YlxR (DUF448 family)